jgi:hypothetical protein
MFIDYINIYWWIVVRDLFIERHVCKNVIANLLNVNLAKCWVLIICGKETRTNSSFYKPTYLHKVESH